MFLKRINTIHKRGKEELEKLREQHRQKTENLVAAFTDVLQLLEGEPVLKRLKTQGQRSSV
jgi:hypothetical protein